MTCAGEGWLPIQEGQRFSMTCARGRWLPRRAGSRGWLLIHPGSSHRPSRRLRLPDDLPCQRLQLGLRAAFEGMARRVVVGRT